MRCACWTCCATVRRKTSAATTRRPAAARPPPGLRRTGSSSPPAGQARVPILHARARTGEGAYPRCLGLSPKCPEQQHPADAVPGFLEAFSLRFSGLLVPVDGTGIAASDRPNIRGSLGDTLGKVSGVLGGRIVLPGSNP